MSIDRLSDDILYAILKRVKTTAAPSPKDWPLLLPALAVCSRWRRVGTPVVYSQGFAVAGASAGAGAGGTAYYSNLALCGCTGNSRHLRELHIESGAVEDVYPFLRGIERGHGGFKWDRVQSLTLHQLSYRPTDAKPRRSNMARRFSELVMCRMPRIRALHSLIIDSAPGGSTVGNRLVDHYSGQLTCIKSLIPLALTAPAFSRELTRLQLTIGAGTMRLPLVCAATLRRLSLCNVPQDYTWQPFAEGRAGGPVVFSSLHHLSIYYMVGQKRAVTAAAAAVAAAAAAATAISDAQSGPRLHFPALQTLYLFRCYSGCPILETAALPDTMDTVYLHCAPAALKHMAGRGWMRIRRLEVNLETGLGGSARRLLEHSNRIFGDECAARSAGVTIGSVPETLDVAMVAWTHLASLTIVYSIDACRLLVLLNGIPQLAALAVLSLDVRRLQLPAEPAEKRPTLQRAVLHAVDTKLHSKSYLAFVGYFCAVHTGLQQLSVTPSAVPSTRALLKIGGRLHPHMKRIRVETVDTAGMFMRA